MLLTKLNDTLKSLPLFLELIRQINFINMGNLAIRLNIKFFIDCRHANFTVKMKQVEKWAQQLFCVICSELIQYFSTCK